ncbi:signal peptide peptidase SppA [Rubrobacter marinus]|uniref:Signal peptide peptidase SppA n=1 Tax=Rubrobacter marinus TaxID=2653852 RepID=A0A6G8PY43_9ACTN|nr:S49 family peptidase [Rubrobacter marinus]QIN79123.1 signal peptide peptidase SppA [Rubrobacter marinus]
MALLITALVNLFRLLRNVAVRLLRRPPDFVWIPVSGSLPEFESRRRGFLRRRLGPRPSGPSLEGIRSRLDRILADGRPAGVVLRVENLDAGWASLEELRREIERFRGRGKRVVAYLVDPGSRDYYLASAADEIFATPLSTLNVVGVSARVNFLKDALSRVGIRTEVVAVSPYKSAGDTLARSDFSEESREQTERLIDRRFGALVDAISAGRGLPPDETRRLIDGAPYPASAAEEAGLIDGVLYEDELAGRLGEGGARLAEWAGARRALRLPYRKRARKLVAMVGVEGAIVRGRSRNLPVPLPLVGRQQAGSDSVVAALRVAEKNRRVGAVLLHVDSPGGDALASDLIWREVERVRRRKPVVVLMGNAAASGGYYVSAAASHVVARGNTVTGSIGVILTRPVAAGLLGDLGVNPVTVERGARSNLLDPRREPTADELAVLRTQLTAVYDEFKDRVVRGRGMDPATLEGLAGGRVWTGDEALERRLVDEVAGFRDALRKARSLAGMDGDDADTLLKVSVPAGARPSPGEPVREAVDAVLEAFAELKAPRAWALAPYRLEDER